jgi:hypothetical protein
MSPPDIAQKKSHPVEKGGYMSYQTPLLDVIGAATKSIQGLPGVGPDGGPITQNTKAKFSSKLEEN